MKINIGRLTEILNRKVDLEGSIQKVHIDTSDDDLNLFVNNNDVAVAFFQDCNPNRFEINRVLKAKSADDGDLIKSGLLTEFYKAGVEVLQEYQDKRRFKVGILNGKYRNPWYANPQKYLGISWNTDTKRYDIGFGNGKRGEMFRFELSAKEIEKLKKDKDLAIDWDKVEIEEVCDDGKED